MERKSKICENRVDPWYMICPLVSVTEMNGE
jgi:hypothetical protein